MADRPTLRTPFLPRRSTTVRSLPETLLVHGMLSKLNVGLSLPEACSRDDTRCSGVLRGCSWVKKGKSGSQGSSEQPSPYTAAMRPLPLLLVTAVTLGALWACTDNRRRRGSGGSGDDCDEQSCADGGCAEHCDDPPGSVGDDDDDDSSSHGDGGEPRGVGGSGDPPECTLEDYCSNCTSCETTCTCTGWQDGNCAEACDSAGQPSNWYGTCVSYAAQQVQCCDYEDCYSENEYLQWCMSWYLSCPASFECRKAASCAEMESCPTWADGCT